jgi:hypothetical protein
MKMNTKLFSLVIISVVLAGCGRGLPECGSTEAKNTLIKIIKEQVTDSEDGQLYIEPKFDIINTESKSAEKIECSAQIVFSIPKIYQIDSIKKVSLTYSIAKNEAQGDSFSVKARANFNEIKEFNSEGWVANQNYLFKKANLEFLSDAYNDDIIKKLQGNPFALLAMPALIDSISFKKVHQKLLDDGWKFEGESKDDKLTGIYTKDKFTLAIKVTNNLSLALFGLQGPIVEDANIWEK